MLAKRDEIYARQINYASLENLPDFPYTVFHSFFSPSLFQTSVWNKRRNRDFPENSSSRPGETRRDHNGHGTCCNKASVPRRCVSPCQPFGCHSLSPNFFYTDLPH